MPRGEGTGETTCVLWLFDASHRVVLVRRRPEPGERAMPLWDLPWVGSPGFGDLRETVAVDWGLNVENLGTAERIVTLPLPETEGRGGAARAEMWFAQFLDSAGEVGNTNDDDSVGRFTVQGLRRSLEENPSEFSPLVRELLPRIRPHLIRVPYLGMRENEYIYRFRTEKQRNRSIYHIDDRSGAIYQSRLCEAIKAVKRRSERSAETPARLDFGPVAYVLPSHFGFCLGVQNAIERAYECLAENPGRRVFMLSELIHNPFVNEDLLRRGLKYLQSDRGEPQVNPETGCRYWDEVGPNDVVIIPAFGATNEDKLRLIEKGVTINRYDATCMLVEKVWKAARRFAADGYTVIIHGKSEHEETKATFSNSAASGPSLIVRNLEEARRLGDIILTNDPARRRERFSYFEGKHTPGFLPERDLDRVAVVNQTTLLRNETLAIIDHLESVFARKHGSEGVRQHLHSGSKGDTLCYATQVNQDSLERALAHGLDAAVVVGGRNSSNTFQLFRMCEARLGASAFYVQSEENLLSSERVNHYRIPSKPGDTGSLEERPFLPEKRPLRILVTGGASCPDGLIQQVITRINSFFPAESLRRIEQVAEAIESEDGA